METIERSDTDLTQRRLAELEIVAMESDTDEEDDLDDEDEDDEEEEDDDAD